MNLQNAITLFSPRNLVCALFMSVLSACGGTEEPANPVVANDMNMMAADPNNPFAESEMAMDKDGKFLALKVETIANMGAYLSTFSTAVPTYLYATLLSAIANAETSVRLTNAYFAPDPQLLAALEAAVQRGVEVTLILPSQTDSWLVFHAGRNYYAQLLRAGVKIYERQGVILHTKTGSIDGVWSTVGSTNLDWRSFLHNYEVNAVVLGADFAAQLQTLFDADLAGSKQVTLQEWERRGLSLRMKEAFARAWEYWL